MLTDVSIPVSLQIPADAQDFALRVLCRYTPPQIPPPPQVTFTLGVQDPATTASAFTTRTFVMWPQGTDLPANFLKYVGTVPFGSEKTQVDIIEVSS